MSEKSIERLLLVEDNAGDARLLREMFNEPGSSITELTHVESMSAAEQYLAAHTVDMIVLDLGLPDAQGLGAVRRAHAAAPRVPLVVLTGLDDESLASQALQEGAQDYLVKGQIETRGLLRGLRYAIERKSTEEAFQSLSRRLVETQESERRHIARELHDEAGQALVALRYGLRRLERAIDEGESLTGRVAELVQTTDTVMDGLHRLAADLRPVALDHLGLEAALRQYSLAARAKFGIAVRFKARGFTSDRLLPVVETGLYRVVQEAIANAVLHARATRVDLLADHRGDRVIVMVEDDGIGFEPGQVQRGDHFGLLGMRERAEALGGILTVESSPGAGTTIVVDVPTANPHPDR